MTVNKDRPELGQTLTVRDLITRLERIDPDWEVSVVGDHGAGADLLASDPNVSWVDALPVVILEG